MFNNYFDEIFRTSEKYLKEIFTEAENKKLIKSLEDKKFKTTQEYVDFFEETYTDLIKKKHQSEYKEADKDFNKFINEDKSNLKVIWGDCLNALKKMDSESIQLMVTSPPYYNAREYSQWKDIHEYLHDMREIIKETYRVLDNHRVWVFNVGDIFSNPNTKTTSVWGKTRIPLGAYFTTMFEEEGFTFVDDFIWDKGEVQSQRNKNASTPYPLYQYPLNCYEHILIFHKHRLDLTRFPCPRCGTLTVNGNTQSEPGLQSWECKNLKCFERSESNRGKRFSLKTNITQSLKNQGKENKIDVDFARKWRRDIIKFSPVIKINSKGENTVGHTAPFPEDIPEMAVKMFSYEGEKVLDPFGGSFTTPKVAAQLNRIGVGVELNKKDFKAAIIQNITANSSDLFKQEVYFDEYDLSKEKKLNKQI
ncbi:site-specific DNA-methyltransferase [Candidatus Methylopumilus planktonicus]|uniref:DNA-methyltransferase n=1 Tax=Candidatus Methylopumilus planktonicus TaxID=1581557 RepID=UPI001122F287|nr:site-specific DNA-methyltransferase [Candidatus Methylopumilus planktonicus]QDD06749.1 site-specific DNA-methyltransferase [Candidatus Methylopumilus planktonicus]QDD08085.1 site-specific DNA-methyltransferase [Candidatus Methylopumilus planktonicus]